MPVLIKDIADKAGVSPATVSRVLNNTGYVGKAMRHKVLQVLEELDYRPNLVARSLVTKESRTIGLMIPHISSPFFASFASAVEERADELSYNVILCHTTEDTKREERCLNILLDRQVDGIIANPVGKESKHFAHVVNRIPLVFAARRLKNLDVNSVTVDNEAGSQRIIEHLLELGHRRIGIINGPLFLSSGCERWQGVQQAFEKHGVIWEPELIKSGNFTPEAGCRLTDELLENTAWPTAIYAANHMTAIGVLHSLGKRGIRIPDDIAVAAFEGFEDTPFNDVITPRLTANRHPTRDMAWSAVDLLVESIQGAKGNRDYVSKNIILGTKMQIGPSTVKCNTAAKGGEKE